MLKLIKVSKNEINLPYIVVIIAFVIIIFHLFSFLIPFTNNAFVATNVIPIAADVSGFIDDIKVTNGQQVKKGDLLFTVFRKPYYYAYKNAKASYEQALEDIKVITSRTQKTRDLLNAAAYNYQLAKLKYQTKNALSVRQAVPKLEIKLLKFAMETAQKKRDAYAKQIKIEDQEIVALQKKVKALRAQKRKAMVNYKLTLVTAPTDGIVDNMYISKGTPIKIHQPVFSFIDTSNWWVQANFNETDLRRIRPGDEAIIIVRMYYFNKIFRGKIVNNVWAADRQRTIDRTQQQRVKNENQWLLIPQRLPLQIKVLNPDPKYPLQPGSSVYVYLKAKTHNRTA